MYILNIYINIFILNNLYIFNRDRQYYEEDISAEAEDFSIILSIFIYIHIYRKVNALTQGIFNCVNFNARF